MVCDYVTMFRGLDCKCFIGFICIMTKESLIKYTETIIIYKLINKK